MRRDARTRRLVYRLMLAVMFGTAAVVYYWGTPSPDADSEQVQPEPLR